MKTSPDRYLGECQLSLGLAHLPSGDLAHLPSGNLAHLLCGDLVHLPSGNLAHLPSGVLAHLLCGDLAHLLGGEPQLEDLLVQGLHSCQHAQRSFSLSIMDEKKIKIEIPAS